MGFSGHSQQLQKLTELIPELEDLVETGILAPTTATALVKRMTPSEQEDFVKSMDITQKITQKQVQQYIDKIKQLKTDNPEIKELKDKISDLQKEKDILEQKFDLIRQRWIDTINSSPTLNSLHNRRMILADK